MVEIITPPKNLGTAGGLALGLKTVLQNAAVTHCWILDDDSVAQPGALSAMLEASKLTEADAVTSLLAYAAGKVGWFPGPLAQPAWDVIRSGVTPDEFWQRCGVAPLHWTWATWASMLVTRGAIAAVGLPEPKLWYQGTDSEYALRLSARFTCVLAPAALCLHLPPPVDAEQHRNKELWSLQNAAYVAVRLTHGRCILRHLPGNHFRYWRGQRFRGRALWECLCAFWRGAILGRPAGLEQFSRFSSSP